jgi:tRNA pseudouridine-54 N-methylase
MDRLVEINQLALILRGDVFVRLTLPDPPPVDVLRSHIREIVKTMGAEEKKLALLRAKALGAYAIAMEKELSRIKK